MKITLTCAAGILLAGTLLADEGMWTFHAPPRQLLKERYRFELTDAWLEKVRLASVRFGSGGSGSFVSPDGLVLTNHHVGLSSIHKLSTAGNDLVANGFHAARREDELRVPDLELDVLVAMQDVTERVARAVPEGSDAGEATRLRRQEIGAIEQEAKERSGRRVQVVTLYRGGEYWLYEYEHYTDVRLVFAPEGSIGYFGGDPDNFTYPRFNLDFALFRVYLEERPVPTPHFLRFAPRALAAGDLVFVSGHPGRTERLQTLHQVERLRDVGRPRSLATIEHLREAVRGYGALGAEQERQAKEFLLSIENARKNFTGQLEGLRDPALMARKAAAEAQLQDAVAARPELAERVGGAWEEIDRALAELDEFDARAYFSRLRGDLWGHALAIVRYVTETAKPNGERLPEFQDANLDAVQRSLFADAPIHPGLDETLLRASLTLAGENLPQDDPFLQAILDGEDPAALAHALITRTTLADPAVRRRLVEGGAAAVAAATDPLLVLARRVDPILRELRQHSEEVATRITLASGRIADARFAVFGSSVYPDATFTLRLAFGVTEGYEQGTTLVPWKTTFYGLYGRAAAFDHVAPFALPERYHAREAHVDLATPLNFVHTCDITGGNSGSPTIDRDGNLVGLVFDGNIQSLPNDIVFKDADDRAVSVHAAGILEALQKIYQADALVDELLGVGG